MIFGYANRTVNKYGLLEMKEVSFLMDADALEEVAQLFIEAANQIRAGRLRAGGHRHADEVIQGWSKRHQFDLIVGAPESANRSPGKDDLTANRSS